MGCSCLKAELGRLQAENTCLSKEILRLQEKLQVVTNALNEEISQLKCELSDANDVITYLREARGEVGQEMTVAEVHEIWGA
jgi:hypothetical protein